MGKKSYQQYGKTFRKPKRPFEKERLDAEMKMVGEYGLKNKREVLRVNYALAKIRTAARTLLTLDDKDEQRMFQGEALLRRSGSPGSQRSIWRHTTSRTVAPRGP